MNKFWGWGLVLFLASAAVPTRGLAQEPAVILGIRSVEGDDDLARSLSVGIRAAARQVPGWDVSAREVPLAQMMLSFNCLDTDMACLRQIAEAIHVRHVVYGTLRRRSIEARAGWILELGRFDAERVEIVASLTEQITGVPDAHALIELGRGLLTRLGTAPADPVGPSNDHDLLRGFAVGLAVLGVGAFGGTIASWVRIGDIQHDPRFHEYRARGWPPGTNVCTQAEHDRTAEAVQSLCTEASTYEVLQFVFLVTTVLSAGGSALLIGLDAAQPETDLTLHPQLGPDLVGLTLDTRF